MSWLSSVTDWLKGKLLAWVNSDFEQEALTSSWTGRASLKRLLAREAGRVLCICLLLVVAVICYQGINYRAVDTNLVWAVSILAPSVAILAGASYRKPEGPQGGSTPPQPLPPPTPPATPHGGPK